MTGIQSDRAETQRRWQTLLPPLSQPGRSRVLAGLLLLSIVRTVYLMLCPLELIPDEAYYWDWSRQLDWSYYSKPPMIAWLIALATSCAGTSEFAIRLPATLLGTLGLWCVYELGRQIYDHRTGVLALVIVAAVPGMTALCLLMTIDAPFLVAWTTSVYCFWRMFGGDRVDLRWLIPAIITTGLGLLTKQTALGLFPLAVLFLATERSDRRKLSSVAFALWVGGSLACMAPVLWWNYSHDWITVEHTRSHFGANPMSLMRRVTFVTEFVTGQFGVLSPIVCSQLLVVTGVALTRFPQLQRRERFLLCFGGVPLVGITALSLFQRVQPNWPVALHLTGIILLAAWACGQYTISDRIDSYRPWLSRGIALGAAMSLVVAMLPFLIPASPLSGTKLDPTGRLRGWRDLGVEVGRTLASLPDANDLLIVAATARGPVSELAYYLPGKPRVYRWNSGQVVDSQHDVWGGPKDGQGRDALIVTDGKSPVPARLAAAFDTLDELAPVTIPIGSYRTLQFRVWLGRSLSQWPARVAAASAAPTNDHQNLLR